MNNSNPTINTPPQSASTERKSGRGRGVGKLGGAQMQAVAHAIPTMDDPSQGTQTMTTHATQSSLLNDQTPAKFVLFGIAKADRVDNGPLMRGFIEITGDGGLSPVQVNVAAWHKIARNTGTEYLSLKIGNNTPEDPAQFSVGPFYGRLFRQTDGNRTRYFGFIESAAKTGEDENGQGTYETYWQILVNAKPAVSHDGKTHYISGAVSPSRPAEDTVEESALPF